MTRTLGTQPPGQRIPSRPLRTQLPGQQVLAMPNPGDWLGVGAACTALGVTRSSLYRLTEAGLLTAYKIEGSASPLWWRAEVADLARARERAGVAR